jgi:hypothetical protein
MRHSRYGLILALAVSASLSGCDSGDDGECAPDETYHPTVDAADFVGLIDNPLSSFIPGSRWVFEGGDETIEVTVTNDTRTILGVDCVVVRDTATVDGEIVEDTYDWFAQDSEGNVWYMGEDTAEYEGGVVVSTEGSWEAGVDGAQPGIVMHGTQPAAGQPYRQEYYACEAEDMAEVVSTNESVTVPFGSFDNCLQTREYTPLEPDANEYKYYCEGVGLALEVDVASGDRVELTEFQLP